MGKDVSTKRTSVRKSTNEIIAYLENAHSSSMSSLNWVNQWKQSHGEGRSSAAQTVHIMIRITSKGEYRSILQLDKQILESTEVQYSKEPSLAHILNTYKRMYDIDPSTSSSGSGSDKAEGSKARRRTKKPKESDFRPTIITLEEGWQGYWNENGEIVYVRDPYGNEVAASGSSLAGQ